MGLHLPGRFAAAPDGDENQVRCSVRGAFRCAAQVALVQALGYLPRLSMFEPHINTIKYI